MPVRILLTLVVLTIANPGIADEEWNVSKLMKQLSGVVHAKLVFKETRHSIFIITDLIAEGNIEYRAPDYIEKNTLTPIIERVVVDGDSMTIEKTSRAGKAGDKVQIQKYSVQSHPVLKTAVESIWAMLAGDIEQLKEIYEIRLDGSRADWRLDLTPKTREILKYIEQMEFSGSDARIQEVVTIQADGDKSTLELTWQFVQVSTIGQP